MRVSLPMAAERGRLSLLMAAVAAVALAAVAFSSPTPAHAAITACEGSGPTGKVAEIKLQGSSLQKSAIEFWNSKKIYLSENLAASGCGSEAGKVTYESKSSGCGLDAMGAGLAGAAGCKLSSGFEEAGHRDTTVRIGASDFAPRPEEETKINDGPVGGKQAGILHVLPVASAAVTVVVHFPEGCELEDPGTGTPAGGTNTTNDNTTTGGVNDPTGLGTGDTSTNQSLRLHIPAQALEEIWEHKITTWGAIPTPIGASTLGAHMTGTPTGQDSSFTCSTAPIIRIARFDTSGTTFNFKAYLSLLPSFSEDGGTKLWKEGEVGSTNTAWPIESASHTGIPPVVPSSGETNVCSTAVSPNLICRANAEGGGSLANAVKATDGSIGYLDLATARKEGFNVETSTKDDTYWLPLEAINPSESQPAKRIHTGVFFEPTVRPGAHFKLTVATEKGANCDEADYRGIPTTPESDPTLGDWSKAIATGGGSYPVCAITYDLAFDDDAAAYENTLLEEEMARTVKEYLTSVVSVLGQTELGEFDYGTLPNTRSHPVLEDAERGVAAIGWDKTTGGVGQKSEEKSQSKSEEKTAGTGGPPIITPPSNAFSIAGAKVKGKAIVLSLVLPGPGKVQIKAVGGGVTVASVIAVVKAGNGSVALAISKAALSRLAKIKGHKFGVKITVTFTPTGGTAAGKTKTITLTKAAVVVTKKASKGKGKK